MKKILIVNTRHFYGGGDSTYTFNLASSLKSKGHEIAFFAMQDPRNLPDPNSDIFVSPIDFRELNRSKNPINGVRVLTRSIYSAEARRKFSQLLDRVRPDIVHLQNLHAHITPSVIFEAKKRGLPVVWTLHDYKLICPNSHFLIDKTGEICEACGRGKYYQAVLKRCKKGSLLASGMASLEAYAHQLMHVRDSIDAFLCPSDFLQTKLIERGFLPEKTYHLPLFLLEEQFHNSEQDDGYLLFIGRLSAIKGIFPLLEAARKAPGVRLILAGRADDNIEVQLNELLPPNAEYVGMKHGEELQQLLGRARAVVLPSICYENQPFSILEAFARGKPVIASALGGMSELVGKDERGLLVLPGDVNALADAMRLLTSDSQLAREKGKKAYRYVMEYHSPESHYRVLNGIYESLL